MKSSKVLICHDTARMTGVKPGMIKHNWKKERKRSLLSIKILRVYLSQTKMWLKRILKEFTEKLKQFT